MTSQPLDRRRVLARGAAGLSALLLAGCDRLSAAPWWRDVLESAEKLTERTQRALLSSEALAPEYAETDISPLFRANGTTDPQDDAYRALAASDFQDWRLAFDGLVENPQSFSLMDLRAMPARTQITRHDCVEGWSCIGKWTGVPLAALMELVRLKPEARYLVFHCADSLGVELDDSGQYYESLALVDARHPQTILAYDMNGEILSVPHGAPIRLRVERQLGYKMAKYVMRVEAVADFASMRRGRGGYWEDRGYEWYAGI